MSYYDNIPIQAISLYRKALEQLNKGKHELALKFLVYAVMLAPRFTIAHCEMGHCYEKLGRYQEALLKFDKVLEINPSHVEAEMSRNRILEMLKLIKSK